jgi:hypothetical protein
MRPEEVQAILSIIPPRHARLRAAIVNASGSSQWRDGVPFGRIADGKVVVYQYPQDEVAPELFEVFRRTPWILHAGPNVFPVAGAWDVSIRRKEELPLPGDGCCYHITERSNSESISLRGLIPGIVYGKGPRDADFPDSVYYIHVSETVADATKWQRTLPTSGEFVAYRVNVRSAGLRLLRDMCSGDQNGCIIDASSVAPRYLEGPIIIGS